jgi:hypothetical protein
MELVEIPMILGTAATATWALTRFVIAMLCGVTAHTDPAAHKRHLSTLRVLTKQGRTKE